MNKKILLTAAIFGALAVVFGAFGAHTLKAQIGIDELQIWTKGVEYQFYHVFALLFLYLATGLNPKLVQRAYSFFTLGIVFFSGSLYLLATRDLSNIGFIHFIGPITPIGGLFFILGWSTLIFAAIKPSDAK